MNTHTIRNKSKTTPIVTLTKPFLAKMLVARPESVALVMSIFVKSYRDYSGKTPCLVYAQELLFKTRCGADSRGYWYSKYSELPPVLAAVHHAFTSGLKNSSLIELDELLAIAEAFYDLLDFKLASQGEAEGRKMVSTQV